MLKVLQTSGVTHYLHPFNGFIEQWEFAKTKCSGDYIFGLCPDELPSPHLLLTLRDFLKDGKTDAIQIPKINLYVDATKEKVSTMYTGNRPQSFLLQEHINADGWHCWPDYQMRVSRNVDKIKRIDGTHGSLGGCEIIKWMPENPMYAILHIKTVAHQERILKTYDKLLAEGKQ